MTIAEFLAQWRDDQPTVPVFTSGSTGKPKLMMAEKARMEASARMTCQALGLHPGDKALVCLPMDYIAGKMMVVRSLVCQLQMVSIEPQGHPMTAIADDEVIDFAAMVPMQVFNSLGNEAELRRLKAIKNILIGGGAIDKELELQLRQFPHAVWSSYGMTETLSHIALRKINGDNADDNLWYRPLPGVGITLDANDCLVIDAPAVCPTVLHTHDIAVVDRSQGYVRFKIVGRIDNVVCSGGVKIQIEEVEQALAPHLSAPFIMAKRPSKKYGEEMVMLTEAADATRIMSVCHDVLPKYWQPKEIIQVDQIPMTETGKPKRNLF
ncbi:AMP-binding protein [Hallella sp.]|uniref:AMP-binding protein n=1 Tax=Hallella sp. TaxID=2980186 RepID=UPI003079494C